MDRTQFQETGRADGPVRWLRIAKLLLTVILLALALLEAVTTAGMPALRS